MRFDYTFENRAGLTAEILGQPPTLPLNATGNHQIRRLHTFHPQQSGGFGDCNRVRPYTPGLWWSAGKLVD